MKRKNVKSGIFIALFITAFAASGCEKIKEAYGSGDGGTVAAEEEQIYAVNVQPASPGQIQDYIALSGDVLAASTVDAYSEATGKVTRVMVSAGSRVAKDAPLAEIDPSRPGMEYVEYVVRSPIAGTVVALPAEVGMTVSQAVPLARIASGSALEIKVYVAERFISRVALRQKCEITLDAWPGETFSGTITETAPVVDPTSRTMEVKVGVENRGSRLKAGMFAKVRIITEEHDNIVKLPASALIQRFGESYVFVAEPYGDSLSARKRTVKPGILIDGVLEIQEGLAAGEEVIIRGQSLLEDGSRVNVIDRQPAIE